MQNAGGWRPVILNLLLAGLWFTCSPLPVSAAGWPPPPSDAALVNVNGCSGVRVDGDPREVTILTAAHCVQSGIGILVEWNSSFSSANPVFWAGDHVLVNLLSQAHTEAFLRLNTAVLSSMAPAPGAALWMLNQATETSGKGPASVSLVTPVLELGKLFEYNLMSFRWIWAGGMYRGHSGSPIYHNGAVVGSLSVGIFRDPTQATFWGGYQPVTDKLIEYLQKARRGL